MPRTSVETAPVTHPMIRRLTSWRGWLKFLAQLALLVAAVLTTRASVADHYFVPSGSMEPTIRVGDRLLVNKLSYGLRLPATRMWVFQAQPDRGDVVVFQSPHDEDVVMVKRLVGLPGDTLRFDGTYLWVNDQRADHLATEEGLWEDLGGVLHPLVPGDQGPPTLDGDVRVPEGYLFVMGDHRGNSADSRAWGFVPLDNLLGRATTIIYSRERDLPFGDRWLLPLEAHEHTDARMVR